MHNTIKTLLLSLSLIGLTACDKVNQENYQKIKAGIEYQEVTKFLGEPNNCDTLFSAKSCQWGTESRQIDIKFVGNQVVLYTSVGLQ